MTNEGITKLLKERTKNPRVGLPSGIDFSLDNGLLKVLVTSPTDNMQTDGAAFEGWILALKSWLSEEIESVKLDFVIPESLHGNPEACHYNRFLYRVSNLLRLFPSWFTLDNSRVQIVQDFMNWLQSSNCLLNHSLKERESVIQTENMERQIESWFVFEGGKKPLCQLWNLDESKVFNQLPVGVFYEEIAAKNAIFTRGASAIDIWGIGQDGESLHIIELKCGDNKGMGVISEILFYTSVIYDTCISEYNIFAFGRYGQSKNTDDMVALRNDGRKFPRLYSHVLAEKYHPLFDQNVILLIKAGLATLNIDFDTATYNYKRQGCYNLD